MPKKEKIKKNYLKKKQIRENRPTECSILSITKHLHLKLLSQEYVRQLDATILITKHPDRSTSGIIGRNCCLSE